MFLKDVNVDRRKKGEMLCHVVKNRLTGLKKEQKRQVQQNK